MEENITTHDEVTELREQNDHLKQAIKRYRSIVQNFDEEYASVSKYVEKKGKSNNHNNGTQAETTVVYLEKSGGSTVSP
jgi:predicted RNase H-like nuclease (RuvC/YqgF family)